MIETTCCIVGGGPAGMVLGFLLARAGVEVVVLEKHSDFLRDFRGDTIHPSTLQILHELGLLDEFLKRPHQEARQLGGVVGDEEVPVAGAAGPLRAPLPLRMLKRFPFLCRIPARIIGIGFRPEHVHTDEAMAR